MIRSFWCPDCKKKGLNLYDGDGVRPEKVDDVRQLWCRCCQYTIYSGKKRTQEAIITNG